MTPPQTELTVIEPETVEDLKTESQRVVQEARTLAIGIRDEETYNLATSFYSGIGKQVKKIKEFFKDSKAKAKAAHAAICDAENSLTDPLDKAAEALYQPIIAWQREQDRKRREEEARLQAEAQKKLDDQRLAEAQALSEAGDTAAAEEVISSPVVAAAPVFAAPKVAGIKSFRDNWQAKVTDIKALCRAVADGKVATTCVEANMSVLNGLARASKAELRIPGVSVSNEKIPVRS